MDDPARPPSLGPRSDQRPLRETASGLLLRGGALLLERRPDDARVYPGLWDTPGGHLEAEEGPEEALVRELEEELGVRATRFFLAGVYDDLDPRGGEHYRHWLFVVEELEGEVRPRLGQRLAWVEAARLPELDPLNPLVLRCVEEGGRQGWFPG